MMVDASGDVIVVGRTQSLDFPNTTGAFDVTLAGSEDAFVLRLRNDGKSLVYSTFLGGGGADRALGVDVDGSGNVYVTGRTSSTNFPTRSGAYDRRIGGEMDAFVSKFDPNGTRLLASTYLGGTDDDSGQGIMLDGNGAVCVGGSPSRDAGNYQDLARLELTDDGEWHEAEVDARLIREVFPDVKLLQMFRFYTNGNGTEGQEYWFDSFRIVRGGYGD